MRAVVVTEPGKVEFNFMWMPAFIAFDSRLKAEIEAELAPDLVGKELTEETLDYAHERVLDHICGKHSALCGLRDYLDAVKFVEGPR